METLFEKNINFMQTELPYLYTNYTRLEKEFESDKEILCCDTNGYSNLRINGKPVHSIYDKSTNGKIMSLTLKDADFDTIFVFGLGLGYHIEELYENFPDKNKVLYEPDFNAFQELMNVQDLEKLYRKNVVLLLPDSKENVLEAMINLFTSFVVYKTTFTGLPTYMWEYMEDWAHITKGFVDYFSRYTVNLKTLIKYNNIWMVNFFKNLRFFPFEAELDDLMGKFEGVPGIVVSSGPSLKKNMHLVSEIMDKAVVVSAGSSINALDGAGLAPHMMLAVDGTQLMSDEYNAVENKNIIFAHTTSVHYDCIEKYQGPKIHFKVTSDSHLDYFEKITGRKTVPVNTGGSCANVAMDFLVRLGCNPVILIGQDLCFTGNVTHSEGVWDRQEITDEKIKNSSEMFKTKDIDGNDVYTNRVFNAIHKWFESYAKRNANENTGIKIVNATEGGLKIEGAEHISFREAIDKYMNKNLSINERLEELFDESVEKSIDSKDKIKEFLENIVSEMNKLEKLSRSRLEILNKIQRKLGAKNFSTGELRKKMEQLTTKLEKNEAFHYFIWLSSFEVIYNIKNASEKNIEGVSDVSEKLKILYRGLCTQYSQIHQRIRVIKELASETIKELDQLDEWRE